MNTPHASSSPKKTRGLLVRTGLKAGERGFVTSLDARSGEGAIKGYGSGQEIPTHISSFRGEVRAHDSVTFDLQGGKAVNVKRA
jgi:hypothetical protein